jgi:RNA polymerase sigma-32 factor
MMMGSSQTYRKPLRCTPRLDAEEETALARQWRDVNDRAAFNRLVEGHRPFVISMARKLRGYPVCQDDLVSEGTIGLIKATERFDPDRGARLATYAAMWIKAAMYDFVFRSMFITKIAVTGPKKRIFFKLRRLAHSRIGDADLPGIATKLGASVEDVRCIAACFTQRGQSLNAAAQFADTGQIEGRIADEQNDPEIDLVERDDLNRRRALLAEAMNLLDERERHILVSRRIRDDPLPTKHLAAHYAVSAERICQIEARAFEKVKHAMLARIETR